ncbi:VOC family protein [Staphylococcus pettenkoferi]|uniref:VOC family protein n=1 Tax=Staphylococcus pettenkoferi TaxID=170573 RepID=UPI00066CC587|nr:glyoxalase/bleomycin resistance/extradiol dioxygenase family protein [Staphylococcus pettenkoferi]MCI2804311.1 glyoxalase/bleomycin resistance/extradiol dioxygenase family protein [Staphylococcus pettenkoferi]MCY1574716.1 glyoxalase/bleomycin resistance/extradiol dioxygenase family protein [Staphylococcus pettenkoferi]MCY1578246.1 glyoxalase/bleomycin resistance/extradiol dioxygenase family protein [Staphylococcus pettenkoferi]MCY1584961.1 glyoxalase/bleomycin resistance/extradiol dioxygenas
MRAIQYFNFRNSLAALNFYEKHLGATNIRRVGGDDARFQDMPDDYKVDDDFTMHASFDIMGETFYCSDTYKHRKIDNSGAIVSLTFDYDDEADRQRAIDFYGRAIEGGCEASIPLGETAWSKLYGIFNDPFGVTWMINAE